MSARILRTTCLTLALSLIASAGAPTNVGPVGGSQGTWNTASNGGSGFASGTLTPGRAGGPPLFLLGLTLKGSGTLDPFLGAVQAKSGTLAGQLLAFPLPPNGTPYALVSGKWHVTDPTTGAGAFDATFYSLTSFGPFGPLLLPIGKTSGTFVDPPSSPTGPDFLGSYQATWKLF